MNSLSYLQKQLTHLQQKYPYRSRYCALRMIISSIHALFMKNDKKKGIPLLGNQYKTKLLQSAYTIIFSIKGGLGDFIIACNYIYCFHQYLSDTKFNLKIHYSSQKLLDTFAIYLPGVCEVNTNLKDLTGSLTVELNRFPRVLSGETEKLSTYSSKLATLLSSWEQFYKYNHKFFDLLPQIDGLANHYAQILGTKRINQADIAGLLSMTEEYKWKIPTPSNETEILAHLGLKINRPFITIQRGQGLTTVEEKNNKLWPLTYYQQLIKLLKTAYPQYQLVQLGTDQICFCDDFEGVDINLRGKTNFEQLMVLLKYAKLHIDSEGGLIHLRHALHAGPSVVLFGPTSPDVYGYKENLNLSSHTCPIPCEWITNDWLVRCARRTDKNICMKSLSPQIVFKEIKKFFVE